MCSTPGIFENYWLNGSTHLLLSVQNGPLESVQVGPHLRSKMVPCIRLKSVPNLGPNHSDWRIQFNGPKWSDNGPEPRAEIAAEIFGPNPRVPFLEI